MHRNAFAALVAAALLAPVGAGTAIAGPTKQVHYVGIHPIPKSTGGGICYIEGPHVHIYDADKIQYRDHEGAFYFVGDPVAYGYDGEHHAYKGHHPIYVDVLVGGAPDTEYCYLNGPHYHAFAPPEGPDFVLAGNAYFYVDPPPPVYVEARPAMMKINAIYEPIVYERPVITVEAPTGWIGARAEFLAPAPAVAVRGRASAGVVVAPPTAGISVHVVVPPPPSIHIGVGVGVGVRAGAGVGIGVGGGGGRGRHRGHR